jgi:putative transposase
MPDHLHIVAEGSADDSNCLTFARVFKQRTAFTWKQLNHAQLWQKGFHDHVLRNDEDTRSIVRYVLENPVRAGLVESKDPPYMDTASGREDRRGLKTPPYTGCRITPL